MAILPIIIAPDPRLKATCEPVQRVDDAVRRLMDDMLESMYDANGIGLAAPQIGKTVRVIVVDVSRDEEEPNPLFLANPEIVAQSEETIAADEGCLSLPEHFAEVTRPVSVRVRHLDRDGKERELDAEGILAKCVQHEMDHLEGVLFVDHLTTLKRSIILRKLTKTKKLAKAG
jgi:peptide deformylase